MIRRLDGGLQARDDGIQPLSFRVEFVEHEVYINCAFLSFHLPLPISDALKTSIQITFEATTKGIKIP